MTLFECGFDRRDFVCVTASFDDRLEDALHLSAKEIETLKGKNKKTNLSKNRKVLACMLRF